jgi:hypothetical protein
MSPLSQPRSALPATFFAAGAVASGLGHFSFVLPYAGYAPRVSGRLPAKQGTGSGNARCLYTARYLPGHRVFLHGMAHARQQMMLQEATIEAPFVGLLLLMGKVEAIA